MDEHLEAATRLVLALGGVRAVIDRRYLTSDDDVDAIARAIALDARVMRVETTPEAVRVLAMQLRLRELAPPASVTAMPLARLVEHALACPVAWSATLIDRLEELASDVGEFAATVALARALDPHGGYRVVRARRAA